MNIMKSIQRHTRIWMLILMKTLGNNIKDLEKINTLYLILKLLRESFTI